MKYNFLKIDAIAFDHCNYIWKYDISRHYVATETSIHESESLNDIQKDVIKR